MKKLLVVATLVLSLLAFSESSIASYAVSTPVNEVPEYRDYQVVPTDEYRTKTLLDKSETINGEYKQVKVTIISSDERSSVSDADIKEAYYCAMDAYDFEMKLDVKGNQIGTYNYFLVGESVNYFYEQLENRSGRAKLDVIVLSELEKVEARTTSLARDIKTSDNTNDLTRGSDGFYGRVKVNNTTTKYNSAKVMLPSQTEIIVNSSASLYIYAGFAGGKSDDVYGQIDADMGVGYSVTNGVWKAGLHVYNDTAYATNYLPNYDAATYRNGYLPGTAIDIVCHPYNDLTTGGATVGRVRLKVYGLAKYADMFGNGGNTYLTTIAESYKDYQLKSVQSHKWLTTLAGSPNSTGYNIGRFTNVSINGSIIPQSSFIFEQDGASFTNKGNGKFTITVNH